MVGGDLVGRKTINHRENEVSKSFKKCSDSRLKFEMSSNELFTEMSVDSPGRR